MPAKIAHRVTNVSGASAKIDEERVNAECITLAKKYEALGGGDDLAVTFRTLHGTPAMEPFVKNLDAALAKVKAAEKAITVETGHGGGGEDTSGESAEVLLDKKAKEIEEKLKVTFEKAKTIAIRENPKLYSRSLKEAKRRIGATVMFDDADV